jgi:hypothetical protein
MFSVVSYSEVLHLVIGLWIVAAAVWVMLGLSELLSWLRRK